MRIGDKRLGMILFSGNRESLCVVHRYVEGLFCWGGGAENGGSER